MFMKKVLSTIVINFTSGMGWFCDAGAVAIRYASGRLSFMM